MYVCVVWLGEAGRGGVERRGKRKAEEEEEGDLGGMVTSAKSASDIFFPSSFFFYLGLFGFLVGFCGEFVMCGVKVCLGGEFYLVSFSFSRFPRCGSCGFKKYGYIHMYTKLRGKKASGF